MLFLAVLFFDVAFVDFALVDAFLLGAFLEVFETVALVDLVAFLATVFVVVPFFATGFVLDFFEF